MSFLKKLTKRSSAPNPPQQAPVENPADIAYREAVRKQQEADNLPSDHPAKSFAIEEKVQSAEKALSFVENQQHHNVTRWQKLHRTTIDALKQQGTSQENYSKIYRHSNEVAEGLSSSASFLDPSNHSSKYLEILSFQSDRAYALNGMKDYIRAFNFASDGLRQAFTLAEKNTERPRSSHSSTSQDMGREDKRKEEVRKNTIFLLHHKAIAAEHSGNPLFQQWAIKDIDRFLSKEDSQSQESAELSLRKVRHLNRTQPDKPAQALNDLNNILPILEKHHSPYLQDAQCEKSIAILRGLATPEPQSSLGAKSAIAVLSEARSSWLGEGCEHLANFCKKTNNDASFLQITDPIMREIEQSALQSQKPTEQKQIGQSHVQLLFLRINAHLRQGRNEDALSESENGLKHIALLAEKGKLPNQQLGQLCTDAKTLCRDLKMPHRFIEMTQSLNENLSKIKSDQYPQLCLLRANSHLQCGQHDELLKETATALDLSHKTPSIQSKIYAIRAQSFSQKGDGESARIEEQLAKDLHETSRTPPVNNVQR